jgi:hypothetical protein
MLLFTVRFNEEVMHGSGREKNTKEIVAACAVTGRQGMFTSSRHAIQ